MTGLIVESMFPCGCPAHRKVCRTILRTERWGCGMSSLSSMAKRMHMENYDPSGSGNSAVPKGLQDVQRYTLVNKEKNGSLALVWVYTFTNADYEAAKARGAVHITLGEI